MESLICWLQEHDKLSGWAQFFGAMVAVAIAIGVPAWQSRMGAKQSRVDAAQKLRASAEIVRIGMRSASEAMDAIEKAYATKQVPPVLFEVEFFRDIAVIIEKIEIHHLPSPAAVAAMVSARGHMRDLCSAVNTAMADATKYFVVSDDVERRIGVAHFDLAVDFNELVNECNVIQAGHQRWSKKIEALTQDSH